MTGILTEEQRQALISLDPTDSALVHGCDHQSCHDSFHLMEIGVATAMATYQVNGEQFSAIIMDLANQLGKNVEASPLAAVMCGLPDFIKQTTIVAAMAYRQYRDAHPDA
jgi:hypothetical protein